MHITEPLYRNPYWPTWPFIQVTQGCTHNSCKFCRKDAIDLAGKTVIPFTTHEGSGLANCVSDVKKAFPKATVTQGFSIYGHEVRSGKAKVGKWLKEMGY